METERENHERCVNWYLGSIKALARAVDAPPYKSPGPQRILQSMTKARIFEFSSEDLRQFVNHGFWTIGSYFEEVTGMDPNLIFDPARQEVHPVQDSNAYTAKVDELWDIVRSNTEFRPRFFRRVASKLKDIVFPRPMPAPSCYLAWGEGLSFGPATATLWGLTEHPDDDEEEQQDTHYDAVHLYATLVDEDGLICHFSYRNSFITASTMHLNDEKGWANFLGGAPWAIDAAIRVLEQHDRLILVPKTLSYRRTCEKASKETRQRIVPPMYYQVRMEPVTIVKTLPPPQTKEPGARRAPPEFTHQWDVDAHRVTRVINGELPLDPAYHALLRSRGYQVYHALNPPPPGVLEILGRHHVALPGPHEWAAVLIFRRRGHRRGPKDKPYIPSTRKPTLVARWEGSVALTQQPPDTEKAQWTTRV